MIHSRRGFTTFSDLVTYILFFALFLLGMPLDGQLGQFTGGTLVELGAINIAPAGEKSKKVVALVWGSLYLISFFVLLRKNQTLKLTIKYVPFFALLLAYLTLSTGWSSDTGLGVFDICQIAGSTAMGIIVSFRYRYTPDEFVKHAAMALGSAQLLSTLLVIVAPSLGVAPNGRWAGMYTAPNYLGSLAFCSLWANIAVIAVLKPARVYLFILFALVSIANLWGTNSVTSIGSSLVTLSLMWFWPRLTGKECSPVYNNILLLVLILILVPGYLFGLLDAITEALFSFSGRSTNMTGRADIWREAFFAIEQKPIFGYGFGSTLALISVARLTDLHSAYIDILFSGGLVAFILIILCFFHAIRLVWRLSQWNMKMARILGPMLVGIITYNLTETALLNPRSPIFIIFTIIIVLVAAVKRTHRTT
jgi:exopolysaccharide production protein ExoQ